MPQATTIAINDSVPASRAFNPSGEEGPAFLFYNSEATTGIGQMSLGLSLSRASAQRATHRVTVTLATPVEHTVDGVVKVAHIPRARVEFTIPQEATSIQRADLLAMTRNALANTQIAGYVEDLEKVW